MALIRIFAPELTLEMKRLLSKELTDKMVDILPDQQRGWVMIHFVPMNAEDVAIGGQLLRDSSETEYQLEFSFPNLGRTLKERIVQEITPLFMRAIGLAPQQTYKVNILFSNYSGSDFAMGGRFLNQMMEGGPGEAPPRGGLRPDQRGTVPPLGVTQ